MELSIIFLVLWLIFIARALSKLDYKLARLELELEEIDKTVHPEKYLDDDSF
ncbi:MAG: hypothetical protein R3B52_03280 [Candidatus Paceibacterota bacterium]